ncbi:MAG: LysR substrate-binding domain-containing protein [Pseudomonadota bacterium]
MRKIRDSLPPISTLGAFEAAGRLLSFTRAGDELHISQAAVSKQIQRLESNLGVALFTRRHRSLALTAAGLELHAVVGNGLGEIARCATSLRAQGDRHPVTIGLSVAMATHCLMPRLAAFRAHNPNVDVRVLAVDRHIDASREQVDLTISYSDQSRVPKDAAVLFEECMFPVCSPALVESLGQASAESLPADRLLHLDPEHWRDLRESPIGWAEWFTHFGEPREANPQGLLINNYDLLLQAALGGHGIALGWQPMVDGLLAQGLLQRLGDHVWCTGRCHFLSADPNALHAHVKTVKSWLEENLFAPQ